MDSPACHPRAWVLEPRQAGGAAGKAVRRDAATTRTEPEVGELGTSLVRVRGTARRKRETRRRNANRTPGKVNRRRQGSRARRKEAETGGTGRKRNPRAWKKRHPTGSDRSRKWERVRVLGTRTKKRLTRIFWTRSYTGMLLAVGILYFGLQARPNTNIRDWAHQEALKRSEEKK